MSFLLTGYGPADIFLSNAAELHFGLTHHLGRVLWSFLAVAAGLFLLVIAVSLLADKFLRIFEVIVTTGIIVFLVNSAFLYGDYGAFDGRGLTIHRFSILAFVQLSVMVIVLFALAGKPSLLVPARNLAAIYLAITLSMNFASLYFSGDKLAQLSKRPADAMGAYFQFSQSRPNYLYIILDEVYGGSTRRIFEEDKSLRLTFDGFTSFNDVAGIYPTTIASIPSILNNSLYENGMPIREYVVQSFQQSELFNTLHKRGYPAFLHTANKNTCRGSKPAKCSGTGSMGAKQKSAATEYGTLLDLAWFRMVPEFIKPIIYNDGNWQFRRMYSRGGNGKSSSLQVNEFEHFIGKVNAADIGPSFKLYHNTLTHSPIRHNAECELLSKNSPQKFENYLPQDACGFRLVGKLLERLRKLGIYENTYIVVSSDHGRPFVPDLYRERFKETSSGAGHREYGYAHATLLVKPFSATGELGFSEQAISLLDISSLFLKAVEDSSAQGIVIDQNRERSFFQYSWSKKYHNWSQEYLPPFEGIYTISPDVTNPLSWAENTARMADAQGRRFGQSFSCSSTVRFADSEQQQPFTSSGLSKVEPHGRWSDGSAVKIHFRGAASQCGQSRVRIKLSGFLKEHRPEQDAEVYLNNTAIGSVAFRLGEDETREFVFDYPPEAFLPGQINTLSFRIRDPKSPLELGLSGDPRKLAIAFLTLRLE